MATQTKCRGWAGDVGIISWVWSSLDPGNAIELDTADQLHILTLTASHRDNSTKTYIKQVLEHLRGQDRFSPLTNVRPRNVSRGMLRSSTTNKWNEHCRTSQYRCSCYAKRKASSDRSLLARKILTGRRSKELPMMKTRAHKHHLFRVGLNGDLRHLCKCHAEHAQRVVCKRGATGAHRFLLGQKYNGSAWNWFSLSASFWLVETDNCYNKGTTWVSRRADGCQYSIKPAPWNYYY